MHRFNIFFVVLSLSCSGVKNTISPLLLGMNEPCPADITNTCTESRFGKGCDTFQSFMLNAVPHVTFIQMLSGRIRAIAYVCCS